MTAVPAEDRRILGPLESHAPKPATPAVEDDADARRSGLLARLPSGLVGLCIFGAFGLGIVLLAIAMLPDASPRLGSNPSWIDYLVDNRWVIWVIRMGGLLAAAMFLTFAPISSGRSSTGSGGVTGCEAAAPSRRRSSSERRTSSTGAAVDPAGRSRLTARGGWRRAR